MRAEGNDESASSLSIVLAALPLRITFAEPSPDPVLTLGGPGWASNFMCPWLIRGDGRHIDRWSTEWETSSEDDLLTASDLEFLLGQDIISITSDAGLHDPVFHITGGIELLVRADTDVDPWMLSIPHLTIVGSMKSIKTADGANDG